MLTQRHSPSRKALALTLKYGRKFPEIMNGKRVMGRINRTKRMEHLIQISKLLIKDEKLCALIKKEWIDKPARSPMSVEEAYDKASAAVSNYAIKRTGSKRLAIKFLAEIKKTILSAQQQKVYKEMDKLAALKKLKRAEKKAYVNDLAHPADEAIALIHQPISGALDLLREK